MSDIEAYTSQELGPINEYIAYFNAMLILFGSDSLNTENLTHGMLRISFSDGDNGNRINIYRSLATYGENEVIRVRDEINIGDGYEYAAGFKLDSNYQLIDYPQSVLTEGASKAIALMRKLSLTKGAVIFFGNQFAYESDGEKWVATESYRKLRERLDSIKPLELPKNTTD